MPGRIAQIIDGLSNGLFVQIEQDMQKPSFHASRVVYVRYFKDEECQHPATNSLGKQTGIISIDKLNPLGFYE